MQDQRTADSRWAVDSIRHGGRGGHVAGVNLGGRVYPDDPWHRAVPQRAAPSRLEVNKLVRRCQQHAGLIPQLGGLVKKPVAKGLRLGLAEQKLGA